jgi:hypothetical protein
VTWAWGVKRTERQRKGDRERAKATKAKRRAEANHLLRAGESYCRTYEQAAALCGCPATFEWMHFLPCLPVARGEDYDRCLQCGVCWTRRVCTWERAEILRRDA